MLSGFLKIFYLILDRGEGREKERERNINGWLPLNVTSTGDLACNPGMCSDWESNQRPFGSQADTQSTEPYQPGLIFFKRKRPWPVWLGGLNTSL